MADKITVADWLLILATVAGPILAVQAQKLVERARESSVSRRKILQTLMATRATALAPEHVRALNSIDLEFTRKADVAVLDAWREYLDHLGQKIEEFKTWDERRIQLLVALLQVMSKRVGYKFSNVQIKRGAYIPIAHAEIEQSQNALRQKLLDVLNGSAFIPMKVVGFPTDDEALATHKQIQQLAVDVLEGRKSIKVDTDATHTSDQPKA